ncbi:MAG TPA: LysM peptidoglycan-binding domain-containing protein [candidate division Zixibacteria bacterium]|nr:LysM peptidoglycan-binding domain-containing protein [candidate division Zixibacteria bacterium]
MRKTLTVSIIIAGFFILGLTGCSKPVVRSTAFKPPATAKTEKDSSQTTEAVQDELDSSVVLDKDNPSALEEDAVKLQLREARDYYAKGVFYNQQGEWKQAQESFEKGLEILSNLDLDPDGDEDYTKEFNKLTHEIEEDYKETLESLGELSDESSVSAFVQRFEDLKNIKKENGVETIPNDLLQSEEPSGSESAYEIPIEYNARVMKALNYLQTVGRKPFEKYIKRSGKYMDMMREIIKSKNLPENLVYLPFIESGFSAKAYSWAHAVGFWQFIASTGRNYGLDRNWWMDERRDFVKSTHAACNYLAFLYDTFKDWNLALAAYNAGEGGIGRAVVRQNKRDFWGLKLKKQTYNYVPLFMASAVIAKNPEKYGFYVTPDPALVYDEVVIDKCLDLKSIAKVLDIELETLRELNPELLRDITPPHVYNYNLRIPKNSSEVFWSYYNQLPLQKKTYWVTHKVQRGETLSRIANKYGVSASTLAKTNNLTTKAKLKRGQPIKIPVVVSQKYAASEVIKKNSSPKVASTVKPKAVEQQKLIRYRVKSGDNLFELAQRFNTTPSQIRKLNGIKKQNYLIQGNIIKLPLKTTLAQNDDNFIDKATHKVLVYIVKSGDTLWGIAQSFGTSLRSLKDWNNLMNPRKLKPGQRLKIYLPAS